MRHSKQKLTLRLLLGALLFSVTSLLADSGDPPARVARLAYLRGTVTLEPAGVDQWSAASQNYPITTGDRIYTDQDGRAEVSDGNVVVRLSHSTDLTVSNLTDQLVQLGLDQGTIRVRVYRLDTAEQVEVDTPNGAISITQPGDIRIESYPADSSTLVAVNSGEVQITGPDLSQTIEAGEAVRLVGTNPIVVSTVTLPPPEDFDNWSRQRDNHIMASITARYVNASAVGADDLDDYGSWSPESDYGPIWYPSHIEADWAPYREGHWIWTAIWGWTWVDDDPWGYAPFHYGRWVWFHARWGWVPGSIEVVPVWAPAFVAFVGGAGFSLSISVGGGTGIAAWFPLGPGEPYYPWYHCSEQYVRVVNVTNVNVRYIRNTTIVNNFNIFLQNPHSVSVLNNIRYANREVAITAVPQRDFASAKPVRSSLIKVDPKQLQHAQIIPHPSIAPTIRSVVPHPVSNVPVPASRPRSLMQNTHGIPATSTARLQTHPNQPKPSSQQNVGAQRSVGAAPPPIRPGGMATAPPRGSVVPPQSSVHNPEAASQRPLVVRRVSPAPAPTFRQQQPALNLHPGRPLEPQQMENLKSGRPAGVAMDREFPPHAASRPVPRPPRSVPAPRPAPPPHQRP